MVVEWEDYGCAVVKEKLSNGQTFYMEFCMFDYNAETNYWNISVSVYNKRKHKDINEERKTITSTSPFETAVMAMKAFAKLEKEVLMLHSGYNNTFMCYGTDARRNEVYYKYLSKRGYEKGVFEGRRYIMKMYKKGET